jgi:hypothetical protein
MDGRAFGIFEGIEFSVQRISSNSWLLHAKITADSCHLFAATLKLADGKLRRLYHTTHGRVQPVARVHPTAVLQYWSI